MDKQRRKFLRTAGQWTAMSSLFPLLGRAGKTEMPRLKGAGLMPGELAREESFWYEVRQQYNFSADFINLENGYYSLASRPVLEAQVDNMRRVNQQASYYFRKKMYPDRAVVKKKVADYAGVDAGELAFVRNTTEAMNILILGLPMDSGDEFLYNNQDYFSMKESIEYRAKRFGIVARKMDLPLHMMTDAEIVKGYEQGITPRTKILLLTHLINVTGQVLPVKEIAAMAKARGVEVICDVAQSFSQLDYKLPDLGVDYVGASLHKWLGAPLGTGFLHIRKEKIPLVQPLIGVASYKEDDIRKFEYWGTHPAHSDLTVAAALQFHESIGAANIMARLRYLKTYWRSRLEKNPRVEFLTPKEEGRSCALTAMRIKDMAPPDLEKALFERYGIYISSIDYQGIRANRITPHIYTSLRDLDLLVAAINEITLQ